MFDFSQQDEFELTLRKAAIASAQMHGVDLPAGFVDDTARMQDMLAMSDQDVEVAEARLTRTQRPRKRYGASRRATNSQLGYLSYLARKNGAQIPRGKLDSRKAAWLIDRLERIK